MTLDLTGAVLVGFDLDGCQLGRATFTEAQFHGYTNLHGTQFHRDTGLSKAQFHGITNLCSAQFHERGLVNLGEVRFYGITDLNGALFHGVAYMAGMKFYKTGPLSLADEYEVNGLKLQQNSCLRGARVTYGFGSLLPLGWTAVPVPGEKLLRVEAAQAPPDAV